MISDNDSVFNNCFGEGELEGMINTTQMDTVFANSFKNWLKRPSVKVQVIDVLCAQKGKPIQELIRYVVDENDLYKPCLWVDLDLFLEYIKAENRPVYTFICKMVEMAVEEANSVEKSEEKRVRANLGITRFDSEYI